MSRNGKTYNQCVIRIQHRHAFGFHEGHYATYLSLDDLELDHPYLSMYFPGLTSKVLQGPIRFGNITYELFDNPLFSRTLKDWREYTHSWHYKGSVYFVLNQIGGRGARTIPSWEGNYYVLLRDNGLVLNFVTDNPNIYLPLHT